MSKKKNSKSTHAKFKGKKHSTKSKQKNRLAHLGQKAWNKDKTGIYSKETIRKIKNHIDILTLTATPIPRTLQQSLVGVRDTSKIDKILDILTRDLI